MKRRSIINAIDKTPKEEEKIITHSVLPRDKGEVKKPTLEEIEATLSKEEIQYLNGLFEIFIENIDWNTIYDD
jgi:hypothetical protein